MKWVRTQVIETKTQPVPVTLKEKKFSISNFRCVLNVVCFLLGNSPATEFRRRGITQKKAHGKKSLNAHLT